MYPTVDQAVAVVTAVQEGLHERRRRGATVPRAIVCPPFVALPALRAVADEQLVHLGAQNCHWEAEGPYTGEVSPPMLRGLAEYVMVGHSERRAAGDTDDAVARKVAAVVAHGMVPILFVGEDRRGDDAVAATEERLRRALSGVDPATDAVLVVYEPAWAIGADAAAPADHVRRAVEHVKGVLGELGVRRPEVLYGGTVNDDNVDDLVAVEALDGVGATRASLSAEGFLHLVDRLMEGPKGAAG
jgi:triosephosphate isomerase